MPAVVAAGAGVLSPALVQGGEVKAILDGYRGTLYVAPTDAALDEAARHIANLQRLQAEEAKTRLQPATTTDGHRVEIGANANRADQARRSLEAGAEGVGLMRTEFLFLERDHVPDEDEQYEANLVPSGANVPVGFGSRPFFEGDLLVRVASADINKADTAAQVLAAIDQIIPFMEMPDLLVEDPKALNGAGLTAINVGARLGVVGKPLPVPADDRLCSSSRSICFCLSVRRTGTSTEMWAYRSPGWAERRPLMPLPRRRKTLPGCTPSGSSISALPPSVGTWIEPPSAAVTMLIGTSQCR